MRVAILYNPRAGRGKGSRVAATFESAATRDGHAVRSLDVTTQGQDSAALVEWSEAVAIVGGDGTLHHTLPALLRHPRPIYHAAMGTENLFAREFAHAPRPELFLQALRRAAVRTIDVAELSCPASGSPAIPFAIMASLGPDASVIHRLAAARDGPIHHLSYLKPTIAELFSPRIPTLSIRVDGRVLVDARPGMVVIANMRHYAVRLDPVSKADPGDGLLDVLFLPGESILGVGARLVACRVGGASAAQGARGRKVEVEIEGQGELLPQADGEAVLFHQDRPCPGSTCSGPVMGSVTHTHSLVVATVNPKALSVFDV